MRRNTDGLCSKCKIGERQRRGWCRECVKEARTGWNLKYKYGISVAERDAIIIKQKFKCAACNRKFDIDIIPNVDHCHETGTTRSVLCNPCNASLGLMKEDPKLIRKLARYAEQIKKNKQS